ncbi:hypothetical protein HYU96_00400 [Candidatus Daviesbacteria bacterium]|nr:hypothetical protein [Candidatus Daviesbacteria bacterium]
MPNTVKETRITFVLPKGLFNKLNLYCKEFDYRQAEFIRQLIREKLFSQPSDDTDGIRFKPQKQPIAKLCNICRLPKNEDSIDFVESSVDGKLLKTLMCSDCFESLPDDMKSNYHPLEP